jgi:hypothetical protein
LCKVADLGHNPPTCPYCAYFGQDTPQRDESRGERLSLRAFGFIEARHYAANHYDIFGSSLCDRGHGAVLVLMLVSFVENNPYDVAPLFILALYPLPSFVAAYRRHNAVLDIIIFNLWLGWTVIGWIGALIWACNWDVEVPAPAE